jgi:hypothetical protein
MQTLRKQEGRQAGGDAPAVRELPQPADCNKIIHQGAWSLRFLQATQQAKLRRDGPSGAFCRGSSKRLRPALRSYSYGTLVPLTGNKHERI